MISSWPIQHPKPHHWKHSPLNMQSQFLYRTTSLKDAVNTYSKMVFSVWLKENGGGGADRPFVDWGHTATTYLKIWITSANKVAIISRDPSSSAVMQWTSTSSVPLGSWYNLLMYVDVYAAPASRVVTCYVNGTLYPGAFDLNQGAGALFIPFAPAGGDYRCNVFRDIAGSSFLSNNTIAQMWLCPETTFRDLSMAANRERFRDSSGNPVFLGVKGSQPFGVKPLFFINGPAVTCHINRSGDDVMTIYSGPMLDA